MNEKELQDLWKKLKNGVDDLGNYTYDKFKERMLTADGRSNFYKLYGDHLQLGDFELWEKNLINTQPVSKKIIQYVLPPKQDKTLVIKNCNKNIFPWKKGCKNEKIAQLNQILLGDTNEGIYGTQLYNYISNLGLFRLPNEKEGEISEFIYKKLIENSVQESEVKIRKKVVKETVKNVLKQRLNKK